MKIKLPLPLRAAVLAAAMAVSAPIGAYADYEDLVLKDTGDDYDPDCTLFVNSGDDLKYGKITVKSDGRVYMSGGTVTATKGIEVSNWGYIDFGSGTINGDVNIKSKGQIEAYGSQDCTINGALTLNSGARVEYYGSYPESGYSVGTITVNGTLDLKAGAGVYFNYWYVKGEISRNELPLPEDGTTLFICDNYVGDPGKLKVQLCGLEEQESYADDYAEFYRNLSMDLVVERDWDGRYRFVLREKPRLVSITVKGVQSQADSFGEKDAIVLGGSGTMTLQESNDQKSTTIAGATVVATGWRSFGDGAVTLQKGVLDMDGKYIGNDITASGGTIKGAQNFEGRLDVKGKVALEGDLKAQSLTVAGTLSGGAISGTDVVLNGGTLTSDLNEGEVSSTGKSAISGCLSGYSRINVDDGSLKFTGSVAPGADVRFTVAAGTLDLGKKSVSADVIMNGGTLAGAASYAGTLHVEGDAKLSGAVSAGMVEVDSGSLSGGSIVCDRVYLGDATLSSTLKGSSRLLVSGSATLAGKQDFSGGVGVMYGTLTLNTSLKNSEVVLRNGGCLETNGSALAKSVTVSSGCSWTDEKGIKLTGGQSLYMAGGEVIGNLTLGGKSSITMSGQSSTQWGNLTLCGGTLVLGDYSKLQIIGQLGCTKATKLDIYSLHGSASISFNSIKDGWEKKLVGPTQGGRWTYSISLDSNTTLSVSVDSTNTTLTWKDAKGKWEFAGKSVWSGVDENLDNRFYHGDDVVFNSNAAVTLVGTLAPGSVLMGGEGAVTFSGSGSIVGDTRLEVIGSGIYKLNANNAYTGGTFISNGKVIASGVNSFGKDGIFVTNGTCEVDLAGKAVSNDISIGDGAVCTILNGAKYAGQVYLSDGTLKLSPNMAGVVYLNGGSLDISGVAFKALSKLQVNLSTAGYIPSSIVVGDLAPGTYTLMSVCGDLPGDLDSISVEGVSSGRLELRNGKLVLIVGDDSTQKVYQAVQSAPNPAVAALREDLREAGATLYTTQMRAQIDGNRAAMDSLRQMMGCSQPATADGKYRFAVQATNANSHRNGYDRNGFGGVAMAEEVFSDKAVGGISVGYEHADIRPDGAAKYESDDTRVNAHLLVNTKHWQSRSIAGVGIHDYRINRSSAVSTGHSLNLMQEVSRTIALNDRNIVSPFLRVETGYNVIGSCNDGVLSIGKQHAWATDVTLGARYVHEFSFRGAIRPSTFMLEAGVTKSIGDDGSDISAALATEPGARASLAPADAKRWSATLGGSVQIPVGKRSAINAGASVHLYGGSTEVNANVGYSIRF